MTTIRAATIADRGALVDCLASAFSDDPLFAWMGGGRSGAAADPKLRRLFDTFVKLDLARAEQARRCPPTRRAGAGPLWMGCSNWCKL